MDINSREKNDTQLLIDSSFPTNNWGQPSISNYSFRSDSAFCGDLMKLWNQEYVHDIIGNANSYSGATLEDEFKAWELASDLDVNEMDL